MARVDTKQAALLGLLSCARGTTIREMTDVTGWRANTVQGVAQRQCPMGREVQNQPLGQKGARILVGLIGFG